MQINQYQNSSEQTQALALEITTLINKTIDSKGTATVAVSGGKSPIELFKQLSQINIEWSKVTITLVDERFTATDRADSNENLVRKYLLINKATEANFIGLVNTRDIVASVGNANLQVPTIDIAILGMGEDGHTASIFPCCPEIDTILDTETTQSRYIISTPQSANYQRIGLSLHAILEIPHLILSISGDKKLNIFNQAREKVNKTYPISFVIQNKPDLTIFWHK